MVACSSQPQTLLAIRGFSEASVSKIQAAAAKVDKSGSSGTFQTGLQCRLARQRVIKVLLHRRCCYRFASCSDYRCVHAHFALTYTQKGLEFVMESLTRCDFRNAGVKSIILCL